MDDFQKNPSGPPGRRIQIAAVIAGAALALGAALLFIFLGPFRAGPAYATPTDATPRPSQTPKPSQTPRPTKSPDRPSPSPSPTKPIPVSSPKKLNIQGEHGPVALVGNTYVYLTATGNLLGGAPLQPVGAQMDWTFHAYDLTTGTSAEIGTIRDGMSRPDEYAVVGDNIYFGAGTPGKFSLYRIDVKARTLSVAESRDNTDEQIYYQGLPVSGAADFQCRMEPMAVNDDQYLVFFSGEEEGVFLRDNAGHSEKILPGGKTACFAVYGDILYALETEDRYALLMDPEERREAGLEDDPSMHWAFCSYDLTGRELSRETIDPINRFLNEPNPLADHEFPKVATELAVFGDVIFVDTWDGFTIALRRTDSGFETVAELHSGNDYGQVQKTYLQGGRSPGQTQEWFLFGTRAPNLDKGYWFYSVKTGAMAPLDLEDMKKAMVVYDSRNGGMVFYRNSLFVEKTGESLDTPYFAKIKFPK